MPSGDDFCLDKGIRVLVLLPVTCTGIYQTLKGFTVKTSLKALLLSSVGLFLELLGNGSDSVYKNNEIAHLPLRIITYYVMR